ncbi:MAG: SHOCT domain-containing protein [Solirubrobacteraceae bacterium]
MPGLLRGVARTAVAAGTFTAVSNRVSRRQGQRWAAQDEQQYQQQPQYQEPPPPAQAAPAGGEPDRFAQLKELGELKAQGVLTEEEFAAEKARILGQ